MNSVASLYRRLSIRDLISSTPVYNSATGINFIPFYAKIVQYDFGILSWNINLHILVSGEGLSLVLRRWASKKTAGSTKNGRDSLPKNLGVKKFGGEVRAL